MSLRVADEWLKLSFKRSGDVRDDSKGTVSEFDTEKAPGPFAQLLTLTNLHAATSFVDEPQFVTSRHNTPDHCVQNATRPRTLFR